MARKVRRSKNRSWSHLKSLLRPLIIECVLEELKIAQDELLENGMQKSPSNNALESAENENDQWRLIEVTLAPSEHNRDADNFHPSDPRRLKSNQTEPNDEIPGSSQLTESSVNNGKQNEVIDPQPSPEESQDKVVSCDEVPSNVENHSREKTPIETGNYVCETTGVRTDNHTEDKCNKALEDIAEKNDDVSPLNEFWEFVDRLKKPPKEQNDNVSCEPSTICNKTDIPFFEDRRTSKNAITDDEHQPNRKSVTEENKKIPKPIIKTVVVYKDSSEVKSRSNKEHTMDKVVGTKSHLFDTELSKLDKIFLSKTQKTEKPAAGKTLPATTLTDVSPKSKNKHCQSFAGGVSAKTKQDTIVSNKSEDKSRCITDDTMRSGSKTPELTDDGAFANPPRTMGDIKKQSIQIKLSPTVNRKNTKFLRIREKRKLMQRQKDKEIREFDTKNNNVIDKDVTETVLEKKKSCPMRADDETQAAVNSILSDSTTVNFTSIHPEDCLDNRVTCTNLEENVSNKRSYPDEFTDVAQEAKKAKVFTKKRRKNMRVKFREFFGQRVSVSEDEEEFFILERLKKRRKKKDSIDSCDSGVCLSEREAMCINSVEIVKEIQKAVPDSTVEECDENALGKISGENECVEDSRKDTHKEDVHFHKENVGEITEVNGEESVDTQNKTENIPTASNSSKIHETQSIREDTVNSTNIVETHQKSGKSDIIATSLTAGAPVIEANIQESVSTETQSESEDKNAPNDLESTILTGDLSELQEPQNIEKEQDLTQLLQLNVANTCHITTNGNVLSIAENTETDLTQSILEKCLEQYPELLTLLPPDPKSSQCTNAEITSHIDSATSGDLNPLVLSEKPNTENVSDTNKSEEDVVITDLQKDSVDELTINIGIAGESTNSELTAQEKDEEPNDAVTPRLRVLSSAELGSRWCPTPLHTSGNVTSDGLLKANTENVLESPSIPEKTTTPEMDNLRNTSPRNSPSETVSSSTSQTAVQEVDATTQQNNTDDTFNTETETRDSHIRQTIINIHEHVKQCRWLTVKYNVDCNFGGQKHDNEKNQKMFLDRMSQSTKLLVTEMEKIGIVLKIKDYETVIHVLVRALNNHTYKSEPVSYEEIFSYAPIHLSTYYSKKQPTAVGTVNDDNSQATFTSLNIRSGGSWDTNLVPSRAQPPVNPVPPRMEPPVKPVPQRVEPPVNPVPHRMEPPVKPVPRRVEPPVNPVPHRVEPPVNPVPPRVEPPANPVPQRNQIRPTTTFNNLVMLQTTINHHLPCAAPMSNQPNQQAKRHTRNKMSNRPLPSTYVPQTVADYQVSGPLPTQQTNQQAPLITPSVQNNAYAQSRLQMNSHMHQPGYRMAAQDFQMPQRPPQAPRPPAPPPYIAPTLVPNVTITRPDPYYQSIINMTQRNTTQYTHVPTSTQSVRAHNPRHPNDMRNVLVSNQLYQQAPHQQPYRRPSDGIRLQNAVPVITIPDDTVETPLHKDYLQCVPNVQQNMSQLPCKPTAQPMQSNVQQTECNNRLWPDPPHNDPLHSAQPVQCNLQKKVAGRPRVVQNTRVNINLNSGKKNATQRCEKKEKVFHPSTSTNVQVAKKQRVFNIPNIFSDIQKMMLISHVKSYFVILKAVQVYLTLEQIREAKLSYGMLGDFYTALNANIKQSIQSYCQIQPEIANTTNVQQEIIPAASSQVPTNTLQINKTQAKVSCLDEDRMDCQTIINSTEEQPKIVSEVMKSSKNTQMSEEINIVNAHQEEGSDVNKQDEKTKDGTNSQLNETQGIKPNSEVQDNEIDKNIAQKHRQQNEESRSSENNEIPEIHDQQKVEDQEMSRHKESRLPSGGIEESNNVFEKTSNIMEIEETNTNKGNEEVKDISQEEVTDNNEQIEVVQDEKGKEEIQGMEPIETFQSKEQEELKVNEEIGVTNNPEEIVADSVEPIVLKQHIEQSTSVENIEQQTTEIAVLQENVQNEITQNHEQEGTLKNVKNEDEIQEINSEMKTEITTELTEQTNVPCEDQSKDDLNVRESFEKNISSAIQVERHSVIHKNAAFNRCQQSDTSYNNSVKREGTPEPPADLEKRDEPTSVPRIVNYVTVEISPNKNRIRVVDTDTTLSNENNENISTENKLEEQEKLEDNESSTGLSQVSSKDTDSEVSTVLIGDYVDNQISGEENVETSELSETETEHEGLLPIIANVESISLDIFNTLGGTAEHSSDPQLLDTENRSVNITFDNENEITEKCLHCNEISTVVCEICLAAYYCSKRCSDLHWGEHYKTCKPHALYTKYKQELLSEGPTSSLM